MRIAFAYLPRHAIAGTRRTATHSSTTARLDSAAVEAFHGSGMIAHVRAMLDLRARPVSRGPAAKIYRWAEQLREQTHHRLRFGLALQVL